MKVVRRLWCRWFGHKWGGWEHGNKPGKWVRTCALCDRTYYVKLVEMEGTINTGIGFMVSNPDNQ